MSARDLWRRLCAAAGGRWHIPDEADMLRLAQLVGERTAERDAARAELAAERKAGAEVAAVLDLTAQALVDNEAELDELYRRLDTTERERDSWRRRARHQPDDDEAARHAEVELRGGR